MALVDYYNTNDDWKLSASDSKYWKCQTFTAGQNYDIANVKLKLYRAGTPGTITVSIKAVDGETGKPTGGDLASGTINGNELTTDTSGEWAEITFGSPYSLMSGTQYAIVVRSAAGSWYWRMDYTSPSYAGGQAGQSNDSGSTWGMVSSYDCMFETHTASGGGVQSNNPYLLYLMGGSN